MESNSGAADIWKDKIFDSTITSGSALVPHPNSNYSFNLIEYGKTLRDQEPQDNEYDKLILEIYKIQIQQLKTEFNLKIIYGIVIFGIVGLLTISGLYFSWIQLENAIRLSNSTSLETIFEIKETGNLFFKSSVIGGLVLIISFLFFSFFIKYIYSDISSLKNSKKLIDDLSKE